MKTTLQYGAPGKVLLLTGLMIVLGGLAGCDKEGSDKTGRQVERTGETTGPATSAGQAVDRTAERAGAKMESAKESAAQTTQSATDYIDDAAITTKVKAALLNEPTLSASRIEVTTTQGIVKLSGTVNSEQGISRARELAGSQQGVKSVVTDLTVSSIVPSK